MLKKKIKFGFTIVEVSLFLALSSAIMLGIILATNASVARQRYNDSVNDFADFLRGIYSSVIDVQHSGFEEDTSGKSGTAIYGKLITFREVGNNTDTIYVYDVVGKTVSAAKGAELGSDAKTALKNADVNADIIKNASATGDARYYARVSYVVPWQAKLEKPNTNPSDTSTAQNCPEETPTGPEGCVVGAVLIIRSPASGSVYTYVSNTQFNPSPSSGKPLQGGYLDGMTQNDFDFCLDSDDNTYQNRRNIRISKNGINSTAVKMVEMDVNTGGSKCFGKN